MLINFLPAQQKWNLQQCLDFAMKNSPEVQQSIINVSKYQRQINAAKGNLLPSASIGMNHNYSFGNGINTQNNQREAINTQTDNFYALASTDVFNWKNYLNISLSKINKESSEYRLRTVQNDVKLSIIGLFFQYMKDKSWFEVLEPQISGMKEQIARTEKEVEIGNRAKSDVYDIKANFGTIQEQWISAQNQMNISKINLLAALNINKDSIDFVSDGNSEITPNFINSKEMIDHLVQKNPIFIENQKELEAAKMKIKAAKSDYLPTISAQYQWSSFFNKNLKEDLTTNFSTQFNQNKNSQVSLGLNVPLFQKFQVKNAVETAKLDQQYTVFENQRKLNDLYKTLNVIAEQYDNAIEKNKILQQNFENQKLSFERSEEKYKEGLMDAYTFFVVRNSWLQANFNLNSSKFDVMQQLFYGINAHQELNRELMKSSIVNFPF